MRLLIEGDSYGLPRMDWRRESVALSYDETYPEILRRLLLDRLNEDIVLVNHCRHANTTHSLETDEMDVFRFAWPDFAVVQLGMGDLWPAKRRKVLPLQPELGSRDPWVDEAAYGRNLAVFCSRAEEAGCCVVVVDIPPVGPRWEQKYPELAGRIVGYNRQAAKVTDGRDNATFLDWHAMVEERGRHGMIGEDGIHPTVSASRKLAEALAAKIYGYL